MKKNGNNQVNVVPVICEDKMFDKQHNNSEMNLPNTDINIETLIKSEKLNDIKYAIDVIRLITEQSEEKIKSLKENFVTQFLALFEIFSTKHRLILSSNQPNLIRSKLVFLIQSWFRIEMQNIVKKDDYQINFKENILQMYKENIKDMKQEYLDIIEI